MKNKISEYVCEDCYKHNHKELIEKISISPLTALCKTCGKNQTSFYIYDEFDGLTPCCKKEMKLKLHPDYTSSGIWCFHCGCNLGNLANIPDGLEDLCEVWNDLWDHQINKMAYIDDKYFSKVFITTGKYLCELINQYCYCELLYKNEEDIIKDIIKEREI